MISSGGVVVPAPAEEELLPGGLAALRAAAAHARMRWPGLRVRVVVAADACSDGTARLAREAGATVVALGARNVGRARAAGLREILRHVNRNVPATGVTGLWLATTDADSRVPPDWLARQLRYAAAGWEAVAGTVTVTDWTGHPPGTAAEFARRYRVWEGPHPHVHGANLGFTAPAYLGVGGFRPLRTGEDRALVAALQAQGRRVLRTSSLPVVTSARSRNRAPSGFGHDITTLGGAAKASAPGSLLGAQ